MGVLIVTYTSIGGNKVVTWADVQQMLLISCALVLALFMAIHLLPGNVSWAKAISLAGAAGRLNVVTTHFDLDDR
jgi:SSS family solute:Na+ symporter